MADGKVVISTALDDSGVKNGLKGLKSSLIKIGALVATAFSVKALVNFGKEAISLSSDLEEVQNVVDVAFGDMSHKMEDFAKTAIDSFGISELSAKKTGSTFMAMAKGMGIASSYASDMAVSLTGLSADMSSFYNISQDVTSTALKSIFTGETETLKQFGIVMTEINLQEFAYAQGLNKKISAMTQAEKVQLRYNYIMKQTSLAQGDFANNSTSWANQTRIASEKFKQILSNIGTVLVKVLAPALSTLNNILNTLLNSTSSLLEMLGFDVAKTSNNATETMVSGMEEYTDSVSDAVSKQQKLLSSFDELDVIGNDISSASTTPPGTSGASLENVGTASDTDKSKIKKNLGTILKDALESIDVTEFIKIGLKKITQIIKRINWKSVGKTIGKMLGNIDWLGLLGAVVDLIGETFTALLDTYFGMWDANPVGTAIITALMIAFSTLDMTALAGSFAGPLAAAILSAIAGYKLGNSISEIISGEEVDMTITEQMKYLANADFDEIVEASKEMMSDIGKFLYDGLLEIDLFWSNLWNKIASSVSGFASKIFNPIKNGFSNMWNGIYTFLLKIDLFWTRLWKGVANTFKSIWSGIVNIFKGFINIILGLINGLIGATQSALNFVISGLNKISFTVPGWVPGIGGDSWGIDISKVSFSKIPYLATGAVLPANNPFLAMVGDQKSGTNIEAPLDTIVQAMQIALGNKTNEGNGDIVVNIDGREVFRAVRKQNTEYVRQTGTSAFA